MKIHYLLILKLIWDKQNCIDFKVTIDIHMHDEVELKSLFLFSLRTKIILVAS